MANFILDFYKGEDLYSDGDIEETILGIVEGNTIDVSPSFTLVYHLSKLRQNILNWYPFHKNAKVLEIGSGCGAITGLLCEKCSHVVSVELSKRRATINYKRHQKYDNLDIVVGNLNDLPTTDKFDYIILNGVFEYAGSFTEGERPYEVFLKTVKSHLKPNGILLVAIENRLGLKYFAGASEDHTAMHFIGLNNYEGISHVKTFSKHELQEIFCKVGFPCIKFYYPYPDYKFPSEIFTDATVNNMHMGKFAQHFEKDRADFFNIETVFDALSKEGVADVFANSFLVEASEAKLNEEHAIIYAKMSAERNERFQIKTEIWEDSNGNKIVRKEPLSKASERHIAQLKKNSSIAQAGYYNLKDISNEELCAEYDYLYAESLDMEIYKFAHEKNVSQIKDMLEKVYTTFFCDAKKGKEIYNEQFSAVFGTQKGTEDYECISPANIDITLENIYIENENYCVIDCEWVFNFDIPVKFIMWRIINMLYYKHREICKFLEREIVHKWFEIGKEDEELFSSWEEHFINIYVGSAGLERVYENNVSVPIDRVINHYKMLSYINSKLYLNCGDGYSENNTIQLQEMKLIDGAFNVRYDLSNYESINALRWDPADMPCECSDVAIFINGNLVSVYNTNATRHDEVVYTFINDDPWFEVNNISDLKVDSFEVRGIIKYMTPQVITQMAKSEISQKESEIGNQAMQLEQKSVELEQKSVELEQKNVELNNIQKDVVHQNDIISSQKEELEYYSATLNDIQNSLIWRSSEWLRKITSGRRRRMYEANICIDICEYKDDTLSVQGWMMSEVDVNDFEVVYKNGNYEKTLNVVRNVKREDVAQAFNNPDLINCGFMAQWNAHNMKAGDIWIRYTANGYNYKKKIARCGMGVGAEVKYYLDEIKKNGVKPYLMFLKPTNFMRFLELRKKPMIVPETSTQNIHQDLIQVISDVVDNNVLSVQSEEEIYVIIPVYNGYKYLDKLFKDVYKTNMKFKLLVVNDRSTDNRVDEFLADFHVSHPDAIILENEKNMGFLPSVNRALEYSKGHHVALVNTDVELPNGWLERLMSPILENEKIATTTPFTNSGTICSFPDFCEDNKIYDGLSVDEVDNTFRKLKAQMCETPTGVGFCMGMNKAALEDVGLLDEKSFGKGYAEENDWCQRAIKAGYKNVHICNLYVYHNHGGSFPSDEKKRLLKEHRINLLKKHPQYEIDVAQYCAEDPARKVREYALFDLMLRSKSYKSLYFNHMLGGGATDYLNKIKEEKINNGEVVVVIVYNYVNNIYNIEVSYKQNTICYSVSDIDGLYTILEQYSMDEIIINELVTYPSLYEMLERITQYSRATNAKLTMLMHDYFAICPTINLIDESGRYCGMGKCATCNLEKCSIACLNYKGMDTWKEQWERFLKSCNEVRAFSHDTEDILIRQYGQMDNITYVPHQVNYMPKLNKTQKTTETLNIGVLGVLSEHKGGHVIEQMVRSIEEKQLDVNVILIGYTDSGISISSPNFRETGKYGIGELPRLIYENDIDIFMIPSIWPETFSYTTQEIMEMNMPVAVFDLGAPAERVKQYDKGIVIPYIDAEKALEMIIEYYKSYGYPIVQQKPILFVAEYISFSSRYRVEHLQEQLLYRGICSEFVEVDSVDINCIDQYDKLIVYRCRHTDKMEQLVAKFRSAGKQVLYDIDDYIFEYDQIKHLEFMKDSEYKDFDKYCDKIHKCMELMDGYITSTEHMKKAIEKSFSGRDVIVNRNIASAEMLIESMKVNHKLRDDERVVLGYFSGSKTHDGDFALISDVLLELMKKYENLYLKIGGCLQLDKCFDEFSNRIIKFDFVDWRKLPALIQTVDINLMPLENTFFHACKSENKWMEAALVRVPTIASYNDELALVIQDGNNGYLCRNNEEWVRKLDALICDKLSRESIALKAFEYCYYNKTTLHAELDERIWEN